MNFNFGTARDDNEENDNDDYKEYDHYSDLIVS